MIYTIDTTAPRVITRRVLDRRVVKSVGSLGVVAMMLVALVAGAHRAHAAGLPANIVTSTNPDDTVINKYIQDAVTSLRSPDPAQQQAGRDALVNFVAPAPQPPAPSPAFQTAYSRNLNRQLPALAKEQAMRSRLNAAIAAARVAEKMENEELAGTISEFLKDKEEPVAIWAMKAAKFVIPRGKNGGNLIPQVVDTAQKFPASTSQAYDALTTGDTPAAGVIDQIHRLMEARVKSYANGVPPDALAERIGILKLVDGKWWAAQNAAQQKKTIQLLVDLAGGAGQRIMNAGTEERGSLTKLVRDVNRAIGAIAERTGKPALRQKMDQGVRGVVEGAQPDFIAQAANLIITSVVAEFPGVTAPKGPATKPATAPK